MNKPKCHPEAKLFAKGMCEPCYRKDYKVKHPRKDYFKAYTKRYREEHPNYRREHYKQGSHAKSQYGISLEEYNARRDKQKEEGDLCGLCKRPLGDDADLDHDHKTKQLRKFLHRKCNMALGLLEDNPKFFRQAAEYLEEYTGD